MYHQRAIESFPLQTYASALLFSPTASLIRRLFQHEKPESITIKPAMADRWSACLQTLEGHSDSVSSADLVSILASLHSKTVKPQQAIHQGIAISSDDIWISNNAQNMLWLPTEYRPSSSAISITTVGLGTGSGKVWICSFARELV